MPNKQPLPSDLLSNSREMRHSPTEAEQLLWRYLRDRRLKGAKFRRQHPVDHFILDFYCTEAKLGIELDGSQHLEASNEQYDRNREMVLDGRGIRLLRFWNSDVLQRIEVVLDAIWHALPDQEENV